METIEKLEVDIENLEITIQALHNTSKVIENLKEDSLDSVVKFKTSQFVKELNKEIEWNEQILDEVKGSISFLKNR
ncbi:MAG TPA: hypothetical protein VMZ91_00115 [Candidatus Paceibacterota bacterium]|nr:hypothetical protein [Candidatus Paceibacterota bacterium]